MAFSRPSRTNNFPTERYSFGQSKVTSATTVTTATKNESDFPLCRSSTRHTSRTLPPVVVRLDMTRLLGAEAQALPGAHG